MKILYFSRDYTTHDHRMMKAIVEREHQVHFLRLERFGSNLDERAMPKGVEEIGWAGGKELFSWQYEDAFQRSLEKVISQVEPDILHAGPLNTSGVIAARSGFHPLVQMSWGSDLLWMAKKDELERGRVRLALEAADALIGDCEAVREAAIGFGMQRERIVSFPWGIDIERFSPGEDDGGLREILGWQENFILLHTRNWEDIYGVESVAMGFAKAAKEREGLRLIMMSGGKLENRLRQIFADHEMEDKVHFTGHVRQIEIPNYFRAADLYLSGSHSDGSSVSLMESLASALPVLVSDIAGNREWVQEGVEGWLFPVGDDQIIKQKILLAYEQASELAEIGKRGREHAEKRADWRKNQSGIQKAYNAALEFHREKMKA